MNITVRVHDCNLSHSRIERDDKDSSAVCWGTATKNAYALFLRFRNRLLGGFEADLRMRPVAKRFLGGSAAAAECHSFFDWKLDSVGIDQLHFTRHDVRTVFDCLDCYVSHDLKLKHQIPKPNPQRIIKLQSENANAAEIWG